jgi:hypothetical protein
MVFEMPCTLCMMFFFVTHQTAADINIDFSMSLCVILLI